MTKTAHVIAHSHWDREWYLPFEKHRIKLVELMELLIETVERDPEYGSFHLDGQTVPLEDYLEIMPHRADKVRELIAAGKLIIGPWYILQDEFLVSSEANVRNLQIGIADSEKLGPYAAVGYFPDSFGNMGQAPQILRQVGIDTAVYGRGVKAVGFNNEVGADNPHISKYSEMFWEAPDGSRVLAILFANWYHNGMEIPVEPKAAAAYWNERLGRVEAYASTPELLFMNGCDHQPLQADLTAALKTAREVRPDVDFRQSGFPEYIEAVKAALPDDLAVIRGELRSQWTDGWNTLVNTASSRVYIKQANARAQTQLEKVTEPLAVMAYLAGMAYPKHELTYAWKTLLRNHPHDSICGCSVDEVHREMMTRFAKSTQMAESLADRSAAWLAERIDTSAFAGLRGAPGFGAADGRQTSEAAGEAADVDGRQGSAVPFIVFNTTGHRRSGVATVVVDVCRHYFDGAKAPYDRYAELSAYDPGELAVVDANGTPVQAVIRKLGLAFGYDLPHDRFRQPYWAYRAEISLYVEELPSIGYAAYALVAAREGAGTGATGARAAADEVAAGMESVTETAAEASSAAGAAAAAEAASAPAATSAASLNAAEGAASGTAAVETGQAEVPLASSGGRVLENEWLKVEIGIDGSFSVRDKRSGSQYNKMGVYEDTGDIGNEYMFMQPVGEKALKTEGLAADLEVIESNALRAAVRLTHRWQLPVSADERLDAEIRSMTPFRLRQSQRLAETREVVLRTVLTLEKGSRGLRIASEIDNTVTDHRIRMLFPTGLEQSTVTADSIYELAERKLHPEAGWQNPSNTQHQQAFVDMSDGSAGVAVAGKGLHEYEALAEGGGTLAVTLLRGTRELGDWGVFATPEAQCLGKQTAELLLIVHDGTAAEGGAYVDAYQFQAPWTARQTSIHGGGLPASGALLEWSGERMAATALKVSEYSGDIMLRLFNVSGESTRMAVQPSARFAKLYKSDILERPADAVIGSGAQGATLAVGPAEIVTIGFKIKEA